MIAHILGELMDQRSARVAELAHKPTKKHAKQKSLPGLSGFVASAWGDEVNWVFAPLF